jgi:hypothetical protein
MADKNSPLVVGKPVTSVTTVVVGSVAESVRSDSVAFSGVTDPGIAPCKVLFMLHLA